MKCEYVTANSGHEYPMPDKKEDRLIKQFMEKLADKYQVTSLTLSPEYSDEDVYVFTFQIPEKYNSKEFIEIWDKLTEEKNNYAVKINNEEFIEKYAIDLRR